MKRTQNWKYQLLDIVWNRSPCFQLQHWAASSSASDVTCSEILELHPYSCQSNSRCFFASSLSMHLCPSPAVSPDVLGIHGFWEGTAGPYCFIRKQKIISNLASFTVQSGSFMGSAHSCWDGQKFIYWFFWVCLNSNFCFN